MIPPTHTKADAYRQWYIAERQAGLRTMPVRSLEAAFLGSDPYEVVVFGDIRSLMFPIREPRGLHRLVAAFLRHQGVLIGSYDTPTSTPINHDARLVSADAHASFWPPAPPRPERPWQTIAGEAMEPVRQSNLAYLTASPVRCWSVNRTTLLSLDWFSDFDPAVIGDSDVPMMRYGNAPEAADNPGTSSASVATACQTRFSTSYRLLLRTQCLQNGESISMNWSKQQCSEVHQRDSSARARKRHDVGRTCAT